MNAEFTFIRGNKTVRSTKMCQLPFNSLTFEMHVLTMRMMTTVTMMMMIIMMKMNFLS